MVVKTRPGLQAFHFATELVNEGVRLEVVRKLLGHKNMQTTLRYAEVNDQTVKEELRERPALSHRSGCTSGMRVQAWMVSDSEGPRFDMTPTGTSHCRCVLGPDVTVKQK